MQMESNWGAKVPPTFQSKIPLDVTTSLPTLGAQQIPGSCCIWRMHHKPCQLPDHMNHALGFSNSKHARKMLPFDTTKVLKCLWDWDLAFTTLSVDEVPSQEPVCNVWKTMSVHQGHCLGTFWTCNDKRPFPHLSEVEVLNVRGSGEFTS